MNFLAAIKRDERKLQKQLGKLHETYGVKEARFVGRWQSGDCEGGEEAVGEG